MSNFNKVITNIPVPLTETEVSNLSQTLSGIVQGGGGGGEGKRYVGDGVYVTVNNDANPGVINLTQTTKDKLNRPIPSAVADLTDADEYATKSFVAGTYQTIAGMNGYQTKDDMSAYLTSANASSTYQTKDDMSAYATKEWSNNNFISEQELGPSVVPIVENAGFAYKSYVDNQLNTKQDKLTFAYDNNKISAINGSALAGQGGTTYSAGQYINIDANDTISVTGVLALDEYAQYEPVLMGDANITATSSKVNSHTQWNLAINSTPVVTDTKLVGENSITAHTTNVSGEWLVGLEQTAHNAIASIDGITTDVGTLKSASADWNEVSAKLDTTAAAQTYQTKGDYVKNTDIGLDANNKVTAISGKELIITAHQSLTNYYTKSDTSSKNELSTEFAKYQPTGYYATTAQLNTASSTLTGVDNLLSGHIDYVSGQFDNKLNVPLSSDVSIQDKYLVLRTNANGTVSGWCDFQDQSYSKSEANGTFVATANIDTTTLSGDGKSVSTKLGVKTDVIATRDYVNSSFLPLTGGTVSGQLEVHGGSNFDSQFIKLTREGNSCGARIGLGNDTTNGTLALKTFNSQGQNTVQVNIKHNTNNNELIQVQKGGSDIGFLIPAVTSTTTAGLTNDGILHIIVES